MSRAEGKGLGAEAELLIMRTAGRRDGCARSIGSERAHAAVLLRILRSQPAGIRQVLNEQRARGGAERDAERLIRWKARRNGTLDEERTRAVRTALVI
jgi:hypothetical protein